jgi:hypothetical protein
LIPTSVVNLKGFGMTELGSYAWVAERPRKVVAMDALGPWGPGKKEKS